MREVELKAVVDDWAERCARVERAGGVLTFSGWLADRRYDTGARDLARRGEVLRLRVYRGAGRFATHAELGWKGPTGHETGYKVREEMQTAVGDATIVAALLERLGYVVTRAIDRDIAQYDLRGTTVRFERYPRMDDLVEVEGAPDGIERAIVTLGMDRNAFTSERLPDFVRRWQQRTGGEPALCDDELAGRARFELEDA